MTIAERLRTGRGLDPVSPEQVMRYWLREELDDDDSDEGVVNGDDGDTSPDPDALGTEPALREELLARKPIASRVFGAEAADWYRTDLSEEELRDLRVVVGPHDEDWRALADDDRIESIAERIHEVETDDAKSVAELDEETPKDLREVVAFADEIAQSGAESRLIVVKEGEDPAYVADGNHRAAAHVLHLLRGGEFAGREAYLGTR